MKRTPTIELRQGDDQSARFGRRQTMEGLILAQIWWTPYVAAADLWWGADLGGLMPAPAPDARPVQLMAAE